MPDGLWARLHGLPQLLLGLLGLAVALVIAGVVVSGAIKEVKRSRDTISVTGSAKQPISADVATWSLSVSAEAVRPQDASRELQGSADKVRAFLRDGGLPASAIHEPPISTEQTTKTLLAAKLAGPKRRVPAFRLTQTFSISTQQIATVEKVAARISDLFAQGVAVSADPVEYVSTQLAEARVEALTKATRDARERAETLVKGLDARLGAARSANVGVFQVTPRNSTEVSDYGIYDTSTREKDVTAVVTITFRLEG
jgi:hypothetical protein